MSLRCGMYWLGMTFEPDVAVLRNCCLNQVEWVSFDSLALYEGCGLIADG
jgi:hypothetical protein